MGIGSKIYTKIKRPDPQLVILFADKPVANINDVIGKDSCVNSAIKPFNKSTLLGTAFTVKAPIGESMLFHLSLDMAEPGDVIIVDAGGCTERGLCGEGMMLYARKRGLKGFVIDGAIRDSEAAASFEDFPIYARAAQCNCQKAANSGYINVPVSIGGIVVFPGDIIRGDRDGIVVIRPKDAIEIIDQLAEFAKKDKEKIRKIIDGTIDRSWVKDFFLDKDFEIIHKNWDE
jgi:regulator of RNase E activity RraA